MNSKSYFCISHYEYLKNEHEFCRREDPCKNKYNLELFYYYAKFRLEVMSRSDAHCNSYTLPVEMEFTELKCFGRCIHTTKFVEQIKLSSFSFTNGGLEY